VNLQPEGYFELILQTDGEFYQRSNYESEGERRPAEFIGGLHNKSYFIRPGQKESCLISVNFKPHTARYFIPERLNIFKNRIVCLNDVFNKSSVSGLRPFSPGNDVKDMINMIESFLINNFTEFGRSVIDHSLGIILRKKGFVSIKELASLACLSDAQFRRRFNEEIGMSPKEYCKIVRIKHAAELISLDPTVRLTGLTYDLGYFDQSHFIKDFKSVTGQSPSQYLA
jgi:AraC-like DNA-binding protein